MRLLLFVAVALCIFCTNIFAQNFASERASFGMTGGYNLNKHNADFKEFAGFPNCCNKFTDGAGNGVSVGLFYRLPIVPALSASLRTGLYGLGGTLERNEQSTVSGALPATIRHTLEASLTMWGIEPLAVYNIGGPLNILGGFRVTVPLSATFSQHETLVQPLSGTFENGKRMRNEANGDIPGSGQFGISFVAGIAADFPLSRMNDDKTGAFIGGFYASPEVLYALAINKSAVVSGIDWNISSLRIGVSIGYIPGGAQIPELPQEEKPKVIQQIEQIATVPALPLPPTAQISAKGVEADGSETPAVMIRVEEFRSANVKPLLNYIFFDENSAELASRYNRLVPAVADNFSIDKLFGAGTIETYYDVLNIVGKRLRENPSARITLTGCNADAGNEKGNVYLSGKRAEAVKNYLVSAWKIDAGRIDVQVRNLPEKPSNIAEQDGVAENRRVEIVSDTRSILEPVVTNEIYREITPPKLRFLPQASGERPIATWQIIAQNDIGKSSQFAGNGAPPPSLEWDLQYSPDAVAGAKFLEYKLNAVDSMGFTTSAAGKIQVEQITVQSKKANRIKDKVIDRYSLILFDFDKSDIVGMNAYIMDFIRKQAGYDATFTVVGYTDRIGDADRNRRLSADRAKNAAKQLGVTEYSGKGEDVLIYDNSLPEGRFYSRTVEIAVERPVE